MGPASLRQEIADRVADHPIRLGLQSLLLQAGFGETAASPSQAVTQRHGSPLLWMEGRLRHASVEQGGHFLGEVPKTVTGLALGLLGDDADQTPKIMAGFGNLAGGRETHRLLQPGPPSSLRLD